MTEAEWLNCTDPVLMLHFLGSRTPERTLRLFCIVCCRSVWGVMPAQGRHAVDVAEQYANDQATETALDTANGEVGDFCEHADTVAAAVAFAANAAFHASFSRCVIEDAEDCCRNAESAGLSPARQCVLLRGLVGNSFREP